MAIDTTASIDANKALVRRAIGYNHGAAEAGREIFASNFVAYMPGQPPMDRATFEHFVAGVTSGMPGYTYDIHDQIAQGDLVANRITWRGVHSGTLAGVPATGLSIELRGINMIPLHGDGSYIRSWLHVEDTCAAIFHVLERGQRNRIYNVNGNYEASNKDVVANILRRYFKKSTPLVNYVKFNYVRMGEDIRYSLDDSPLRRLGWTNRKHFEREIGPIVEYYRKRFIW